MCAHFQPQILHHPNTLNHKYLKKIHQGQKQEHVSFSSKTKQRLLGNMLIKSQSQNINIPDVKLFSPLIYDYMARVCKNKHYCLQTLCVGFHILENYCHLLGFNCDIEVEKLETLGLASLEISADMNEKKFPNSSLTNFKSPRNMSLKTPHLKSEVKRLKKQILQKLDWRIDFISFISVGQLILDEIKKQIYVTKSISSHTEKVDTIEIRSELKQKYQQLLPFQEYHPFEYYVLNEAEIIVEQFGFLQKSVKQCAELFVKRVLGNLGILLKFQWEGKQIKNIFFDKAQMYTKKQYGSQILKVEEQFGQNFIQDLKNNPQSDWLNKQKTIDDRQQKQTNKGILFSNIKPLKQSNKQQFHPIKTTLSNHIVSCSPYLKESNFSQQKKINKNQMENQNPAQSQVSTNPNDGFASFLIKKTKFSHFRDLVLKSRQLNKYFQNEIQMNKRISGCGVFTILHHNKILHQDKDFTPQSTSLQVKSWKENNGSGLSTRYCSFQ